MKGPVPFVGANAAVAADPRDDTALTSRVRISAWTILSVAGLIDALASRHSMQDDGVSYLDMGDAIARGDWKNAFSGIWSPLYPAVQGLAIRLFKPSGYSQFTLVHLVNFALYLFALGSFDFFMRAAVANRSRALDLAGETSPLPKWAVFAIGYAVFFWASLSLITLQLVIPDMLMAGFLYLAAGLLLEIWAQPKNFPRFVMLGVVLGFGYLTKAPVFPLALAFFMIAWILGGNWRQATPRVLAGVAVFLAIGAPWFVGLSHSKGRFMIGDSARFNYVHHVNEAGPESLGTAGGHYVHPVRQILDMPPIYEYGSPVPGTSPIGYDPSYWSEGAVPRVFFRKQLSVIHLWLNFYFDTFLDTQTALFVGFVVLSFMAGRNVFLRQILARWPVWLISILGLGMYALVHVELRYVAALITLCWVGLFSGLEISRGREGLRLTTVVAIAVVIAMASPVALGTAGHFRDVVRKQPNKQWQVTEDLRKLGVKPGDRVARLPAHFGLAWARLLGVRVVAEVPFENSTDFWCGKPQTQAQAIETFRRLGVAAIVAEQGPSDEKCAPRPEWHKIGDGTYYALKFAPGTAK